MASGGYGLFQGLNEAYDAYRDREREILEGEVFAEDRAHLIQQREQAAEDRRYGISRRPFAERQQEANVQIQETSAAKGAAEFQEWQDDTQGRQETARMAREAAKLQLDNAGITYNMSQIKQRAAIGAEKYRGWKTEFMREGDTNKALRTLVDRYNSDDDEANDIQNVTQSRGGGWDIEFEDGAVVNFPDRNAVAIHLEAMADPGFHQTYLLQVRGEEAALAEAVGKAGSMSADDSLKFQKQWSQDTQDNTDRLYGKIKQGLVDFGEPGAAQVASTIRSIVDTVGKVSNYQFVNSEVASRVGREASRYLELDPAKLRQRAKEVFDKMPDNEQMFPTARFQNGKPDEDEPEYEMAIRDIIFRDMDEQVRNLETKVINHYFVQRADSGNVVPREGAGSKGEGGDQITDAGLERPGVASDAIPESTTAEGAGLQRPTQAVDAGETTITLAPKSLVQEKKNEYGLSTRAIARGRSIPKSKKRKLQKDFNTNFAGWTKNQQGAWFKAFGKYLTAEQVARAQDALRGTKVAAQ